MIAAQVPELADGGYWYVVPATTDETLGGDTFGIASGAAWYGEVGGVRYAAVRTASPVAGLETASPVTVNAVLSAGQMSEKPRARLGGL